MTPEQQQLLLIARARARAEQDTSAASDPSSGVADPNTAPTTSDDQGGFLSEIGQHLYNGAIGQDLQGAASTLKNVFGADQAAQAVQNIAPAEKDGPVTTPFFNQDGSFNWSGAPDAAAEQLGGYLSNMTTSKVGGIIGGALGAFGGPEAIAPAALIGSAALPAAVGWFTGAGNETAARAAANGHDTPTLNDKLIGSAIAAGDGAASSLPFLGKGGVFSRVAKNAGVGAAQSAANQVATTADTESGLSVNPYEVVNGAVTGAVGAAEGEAAMKAARSIPKVADLPANIRYDQDNGDGTGSFDENDVELANRFRTMANGDRQLGNVATTDSDTSAQGLSKSILSSLRTEAKGLSADLQQQAKTPAMQARLRGLDTDLDSIRPDVNPEGSMFSKLLTEIPLKQSGNLKSSVSSAHIDAIKQGFGNDNPTANRLVGVLRQIQKVTPLTEPRGDLGGLSTFTRVLDPTDKRSSVSKLGMMLHTGSLGSSVLGGVVANRLIARPIDSLINRRSLPKRYVESVERSIAKGNTSPVSNADRVAQLRQQEAIQQQQAEAARLKLEAQNKAIADQQAQEAARLTNDPKVTGHENTDAVGPNGPQPSVADLATRRMFEENKVPDDKYYEPYKLWENETGLGPTDTFKALSSMEQEGKIPQGMANRYRYAIRSFPTSGKDSDITYNLQQAVKNGFNPSHDSNAARIAYAAQQAQQAQVGQPTYKQASQNRAQSRYTNQISDEAQRRFNNLTTEIENQRGPLSADTYGALHTLARSINSAGMDRDARKDLVDQTLGTHFKTPVEYDRWQKAFAPLVAIGNDFAIAKKGEEDAKEEAFQNHVNDLAFKATNYKGTAANDNPDAANSPAAPTGKRNMRDILRVIQGGKGDDEGDAAPVEPDVPPTKPDEGGSTATPDEGASDELNLKGGSGEAPVKVPTKADRALSKLKGDVSGEQGSFNFDEPNAPGPNGEASTKADKALNKLSKNTAKSTDKQASFDFDKEAEEDSVKSGATSEQDEMEPSVERSETPALNQSKAKTAGKTSVSQQLSDRITKSEVAKDIATNDADLLNERIAQLGHGNEGKVESVIYDNARDDMSANILIDGFARKFGIPPEAAAHVVLGVLQKWHDNGDVELVVPGGKNAFMQEDGSIVRSEDGKALNTLLVRPKREDLVKNVEIAKAISMTNRMVNQNGPDSHYSPDNLHDGANKALKDIPDNEVDGRFAPLINFVDALRHAPMGIHSKMLDQIEAAAHAGGDGVSNKIIREQLTPVADHVILKSGRKKAITDKSPLYAVGQLLYQLGQGAARGTHQFFQEWTAGANGRAYSKNGAAHTQAGDIMKGLIRAPHKDVLGGVDGLNSVFHSFGNLLGADKEAPYDRRFRIFADKDTIPALLEFADAPFSRRALESSTGKAKPIAKLIKDGEGFFQVLGVAHELKDMVSFASARFPKLAKDPAALLQDPQVQADLAKNYKTDWLVQLDGNNNAYQLLGLLLGDHSLLQATAMEPRDPSADPDKTKGADIYLEPAQAVAQRIPELKALLEDPDHPLPLSKLRKLFKKPIGTYLYAAEYRTRAAAFEDALKDIAGKGTPIFSVKGSPGLIKVPDEVVDNMLSPGGNTFTHDKYEGDSVKQVTRRIRIAKVPSADGGKPVFKIERDDSARGGKFKRGKQSFKTLEEAITASYGSDLYGRMNRELVRDFENRYPSIRQYLNFADKVSSIVKARAAETGGDDRVTVTTPDGIPLKYSFKDVPEYGSTPFKFGDGSFNIGFHRPSEKSRGRGLAAFIVHSMDAYALRETYRRLGGSVGLKTFNPIHDSYGFHPSDVTRGQETALKVMQELGDGDSNIFLSILKDNGIDPADFIRQGGVIPDRNHVTPQPASAIPTALS